MPLAGRFVAAGQGARVRIMVPILCQPGKPTVPAERFLFFLVTSLESLGAVRNVSPYLNGLRAWVFLFPFEI